MSQSELYMPMDGFILTALVWTLPKAKQWYCPDCRKLPDSQKIIKRTEDPYLALLDYRATPLPGCHFSLAQLLLGFNIWTDVTQVKTHFIPNWSFLQKFIEAEEAQTETKK